MRTLDQLWAIVLAGGDGSRLAEVTRAVHGESIPKQFARFSADDQSMVQLAVDRIRPIVRDTHIAVVVPSANLGLAQKQLAGRPDVQLIAEPRKLGTAPSLLLPLAVLLDRDPTADILVIPAAHAVKRPLALLDGLLLAYSVLNMAPITLLGVAASSANQNRSWIVPGRTITSGIWSVADFVHGPSESLARQLLAKAALWDTLFVVAEGSTLWRVAHRQLVEHATAIADGVAGRTSEALERAYRSLSPADFARDVVGRQLGIAVTDVTPSGLMTIETTEDLIAAFPGIGDRYWLPLGRTEREPRDDAGAGVRAHL